MAEWVWPNHGGQLLLVWIGRRRRVVQEVVRFQRGINRLEYKRRLVEVETVREVVGIGVCIAQRRQIKILLNQVENTAEVVVDMRDLSRTPKW